MHHTHVNEIRSLMTFSLFLEAVTSILLGSLVCLLRIPPERPGNFCAHSQGLAEGYCEP
jgi:hypothetical protein